VTRKLLVALSICTTTACGGPRPPQYHQKLVVLGVDGLDPNLVGRLLHEELGLPGPLVSIDGVQLQDLDYVDVGELMSPPGVVPVVIKSLLFS